ncbi:MAG: hypothetical protein OGMRLDGQ_003015, partial [Candidatus Fervidibacter sp.]
MIETVFLQRQVCVKMKSGSDAIRRRL